MRVREILLISFLVSFSVAIGQTNQNQLSREEALKLAGTINGKKIGKLWFENGDKVGPYHYAGRVVLRPGDHISYQRAGEGETGLMCDEKYWQTRLDFFIGRNGEATVMSHLFRPEIEPTRPKVKEDQRGALQKALAPAALFAIESDDLEFLKLLIEKGLKVNEVLDFEKRTTALYFAVRKRNLRIVKFLLSKGADPELRNSYGERPVQLAIEWEFEEIVPLLVKPPRKEEFIEGVPTGLVDSVFSSYSTDEVMFLSWGGADAPKELLEFLKPRIPNVRPDSRLEIIEERPLGAHSWYRDTKDGKFGSRLQVGVKKTEKGWSVRLRDSVGPSMAGFGWASNYVKKHGYWIEERISSWDE